MTTDRVQAAFRFTPEDVAILDALQAKFDTSRATIVRMSLRKFAELEGVKTTPNKPKASKRRAK